MSGPAKVQPTEGVWKQIRAVLDNKVRQPIQLECDGFVVAAYREQTGSGHQKIIVTVNGELGPWALPTKSGAPHEEARRFWCRVRGRKQQYVLMRLLGGTQQRAHELTGIGLRVWGPFWNSAIGLQRHLVSNNDSIRLIDAAEARRLISAIKRGDKPA